MLGNGNCDSVCNTAECSYDKDDCPCNQDCSYLDFPSCKAACLVPSCNYANHGLAGGCQDELLLELTWATQALSNSYSAQFDMALCQRSDPKCTYELLKATWEAKSCQLYVHDFDFCQTKECTYSLGFCFRSLDVSCARGFGTSVAECFQCKPAYARLFSICLAFCPRRYMTTADGVCVPRIASTTLESPDILYVADSKLEGDGSLAWPYNTMGVALVAMWQQYTTVYLVGQSALINLNLASSHPEAVTRAFNTGTGFILGRFTSLTCEMKRTERCSSQYTETNVVMPLPLYIYYQLVIDKIIITTVRLFADLSIKYCPQLTMVNNVWLMDNGEPAPAEYIKAASRCSYFVGYSAITTVGNGLLLLREVEVVKVALQAWALINIKGGSVVLENVNFREMQTQRNQYSGGVVIQDSVCADLVCGSFTYTNGTVSLGHNGLRYVEGLLVTPFLYAKSLRNVVITNVTFERNFVIDAYASTQKVSSAALIFMDAFFNLAITNCTFRSNFVTGGLLVINSKATLPKLSDSNHVAYVYTYPHITLHNLVFDSNLGESSLITIRFQRSILNVNISAVLFVDNVVEGYSLLSLQSDIAATTSLAFGETRSVVSATTGKLENLWIAPRHVSITNVNITKTMSTSSLITVENFANVQLIGLRLEGNGDMDAHALMRVFQKYASDPDIIVKDPPLFPAPAACTRFIYLSGNIQLSLAQITLQSNLCNQGMCGTYMQKCIGDISAVDFTSRNNICTSSAGSALAVFEDMNITVQRVTAVNNTNWSGGVLSFGANSQVTLKDSSFKDNTGADGAAVDCEGVRSLAAAKLVFSNNSAKGNQGGGLYILAGNSQVALFTITNCQFEGNSASNGGALAFQASNDTTVSLRLSSTQFLSNSATDYGAALSLDTGLTLHADSTVIDCLFTSHRSDYGVLSLSHKSGSLGVSNCIFQNNIGRSVAAIFLQAENATVTTLTNVQFIGNLGADTILKANIRFNSTFITRNCVFRRNEKSNMVMEGGYWADYDSSFADSTVSEFDISGEALAILSGTMIRDSHENYQGGAIHLFTRAIFRCERCSFLNNSAGHSGGAIYAEQDSTVIIRNSLFRYNSAVQNGAVLQILSSVGTISLIESSLIEYNSVGKLGIIFAQSASLALSNVTVRANEGSKCPGVVLMLSELRVINSLFSAQIGTQAAFILGMTSSNATIVGSKFWDADTTAGAGISISSSVLHISDSTFDTMKGGALYANDICNVTLQGVKMRNISTYTQGSLIDSLYSTLLISHCEFSQFSDYGINGFQMDTVVISDSSFTKGEGARGTALQCYQCPQVRVEKTLFTGMQSEMDGAVSVWAQDATFLGLITISECSFLQNSAEYGGALIINNYQVYVTNSQFEENTAGEGGAIWLDCAFAEICNFFIANSVFRNNSAAIKGGGISWKAVKPQLVNLTFSGNTAAYGTDVASYPISIVLDNVSKRSLQSAKIPNYAPGQTTRDFLQASLRDHYGQIYTIDNSSIASLGSTNDLSSVLGTFKATAVQGTFLFDAFVVFGIPESVQNISLSSPAITANQPGDPDLHTSSILITVELRKCLPGEFQSTYSCDECAAGTYSFDPTSPCQTCLSHAQCWGNFTVTPDSGYWRSHMFSPVIRACPNPAACLGGHIEANTTLNFTGFCLNGYEGNMCQSCMINYSRAGKNLCSKCPEQNLNAVRIAFITVALILVVALLVWSTLRASTRPKAEYSIQIKIMTNYIQLVTLVIGFKLKWPHEVEDAFTAQNSVGGTSDQFFSLDCLIGDGISQEDTYYRKMIMMLLIPLPMIAASVIFWGVVVLKTRKWEQMREECAATIVIIFFLILPNLVNSMFSMFSCQEIETGEFWLTADLSIRCWNGKHTLYVLSVGIPGLAVWVFGVPLACLGVLIKYRRRQDELWIRMQYGFLISGYTRRCFYWEFVILYRKVLIIICAVFINNSIQLQALTIQIVLLFAFFLQLLIQPYTTRQLNMTETLAILVADVTIYCGLYYLTMELSEAASWVLFLIIVAVNIAFVIYWLYTLIRSAWDPISSAVPVLGRVLRPDYFRDEDIEQFLELSKLGSSPIVASFDFSLAQCKRKMLCNSLPTKISSLNDHYVPRIIRSVLEGTVNRRRAEGEEFLKISL